MRKPLTKREHDVLRTAVVFGWDVEYERSGKATWDGDYLMPFRAHATLENLIKIGLMERIVGNHVRATWAGREYRCCADGCHRGKLYAEAADGREREYGRCVVCSGTGLTLLPRSAGCISKDHDRD